MSGRFPLSGLKAWPILTVCLASGLGAQTGPIVDLSHAVRKGEAEDGKAAVIYRSGGARLTGVQFDIEEPPGLSLEVLSGSVLAARPKSLACAFWNALFQASV